MQTQLIYGTTAKLSVKEQHNRLFAGGAESIPLMHLSIQLALLNYLCRTES